MSEPITDDDIWGALVNRIGLIVGRPTIREYESGDMPTRPYIAVNYIGSRKLRGHPQKIDFTPSREDEGEPDTAGYPSDVTAIPLIDMEWHFSIHAYGGNSPSDLLRLLVSAVELTQVMEPVYPFLPVHHVSEIRVLPPELIGEYREKRAQIDMYLHGVTRNGFVIDTIDQHEFEFERT